MNPNTKPNPNPYPNPNPDTHALNLVCARAGLARWASVDGSLSRLLRCVGHAKHVVHFTVHGSAGTIRGDMSSSRASARVFDCRTRAPCSLGPAPSSTSSTARFCFFIKQRSQSLQRSLGSSLSSCLSSPHESSCVSRWSSICPMRWQPRGTSALPDRQQLGDSHPVRLKLASELATEMLPLPLLRALQHSTTDRALCEPAYLGSGFFRRRACPHCL